MFARVFSCRPVKIFEDLWVNLNLIQGSCGKLSFLGRRIVKHVFQIFLQSFLQTKIILFSLYLYTWIFQRTCPIFFFFSFLHPRMHYIRTTRGIYKNSNIEYLRSKLKTTTTTTTIRSHGKAERDALAKRNEMKRNKRKTSARLNIFLVSRIAREKTRRPETLSSSRT